MKWNSKPLNIGNAVANHLYYYLKGFLCLDSSLFFCSKIPPSSNLSRFKIIGSIYYINVTQLPNTRSHYFALHTLHSVFQFFFSTSFPFLPMLAHFSWLQNCTLQTSPHKVNWWLQCGTYYEIQVCEVQTLKSWITPSKR